MGKTIRVAMLGPYPREEGKPHGGPEAVVEVLADALAESGGAEVHIVTRNGGVRGLQTRSTRAGAQVHTLPETRFGAWTGYMIDGRRIRALITRISPDIVHVHGTLGPFAHSMIERGWPSVLAIRGIYLRELPYLKGGLFGLKERVRARYELNVLRRARNVICLNRYTSNSAGKWLCNPQIRYIDNPVDESFFDLESREQDGRLMLLAVVRRLKGHEFAVRAVSQLVSQGRDVHLYCVGANVEPDYYSEIVDLIEQSGLRERVHLEGNATRAQVLQHYARASVVVLPSLVENAPVVVSEAMAAGKAVVACPAGGVPEMIEDGKTGLITPFSDPDALARAVGTLLDSPRLRGEIGQAAKLAAEARFRKKVAVAKTLDFYQEILSGRASEPPGDASTESP